MEEKVEQKTNEHLNEGKYQKAKKGLIVTAVVVAAIGITIALMFLIIPGIKKMSDANKISIMSKEETEAKKLEIEATYAKKIEEAEEQKKLKKLEIEAKYTKKMTDEGWFEEKSQKNTEIFELEKENLSFNLAKEKNNLISDFDRNNMNLEIKIKKLKFEAMAKLVIGGVLLLITFLITGKMLIFAFGRNILAFGAQTVVPVGKEVIEEMSPTMGKASGTIASSAAPGMTKAIETIIKGTSPEISKHVGSLVNEAVKGYKKGKNSEETIVCKHCAESIEVNSKFCKKCGKKQ